MPDFIIRDFQSITEAKISVKGFTVLVGDSSSGKSACFRAMFAATHNRFKIGQVQHGKDHIEVKVRFDDDPRVLVVHRNQTGSPTMKLGDNVYSKLARNVPQEVEEFTNFGILEVGSDIYSLNFHEQFQKPLLLEFSQKKVMELLSSSKALDDLQQVHFALSKKREQNRGAFKTVEALVNENNAKISMLKYDLALSESLFNNLESTNNKIDLLETRLEALWNLRRIVVKRKSLDTRCSALTVTLVYIKKAIANKTTLTDLVNLQSSMNKLTNSKEKYGVITTIVSKLQSCIALKNKLLQLDKLQFSLVKVKENDKLSVYLSKHLKCYQVCTQLSANKVALMNKQSTVQALNQSLKALNVLSNREHQLIDVVKNHICPVCGSKVE